jgi:hypothetical protein
MKPRHGIPPEEWPKVLRRVVENQEPLRKVASDYDVSYETVRRVVGGARKMKSLPNSDDHAREERSHQS